MELFLNATSPYARMVRIVVQEKSLADAVTLRWCDPWADDADLIQANPAGRIPALVTEDGTSLAESPLIALYLDGLGNGEPILPTSNMAEVLHFAGLGQNLMDSAFATVISRKHHGSEADDSVMGQRRLRAMQRILDGLETELNESRASAALTLGDISVAVALDYLSFRLPGVNWAHDRPNLEAWHRRTISGASFQQTAFQ
mgnify:CR=1 FL=1